MKNKRRRWRVGLTRRSEAFIDEGQCVCKNVTTRREGDCNTSLKRLDCFNCIVMFVITTYEGNIITVNVYSIKYLNQLSALIIISLFFSYFHSTLYFNDIGRMSPQRYTCTTRYFVLQLLLPFLILYCILTKHLYYISILFHFILIIVTSDNTRCYVVIMKYLYYCISCIVQ